MSDNEAVPRLALVGPSSLLGSEVKDQLAASGFPGDAVTLFDLEDVAGVLTEYGDEARVLAETITENLLDHELVIFCGDAETAGEHLDAVLGADRLSIDCTGAWAQKDDAFTWAPGSSAAPDSGATRAVTIPPAGSLVVARLVAALGDSASSAVFNVFTPASELGDSGLQELSQQSTAVLNLLDVEEDVFGRQQAFDMWQPAPDSPLSSDNLVDTLARLDLPRPALNVVAAPVFHGIALSAYVPESDPEELRKQLRANGIHDSIDNDSDSPRTVIGHEGMHLLDVRADAQGTWLWIGADNLVVRAAAAVAAIHSLLGSPLSDALQ